jgi:RNA-directed DNA polymerase
LKSYCKGLRIDEALITRAYEAWLHAPAGKKNAWRVDEEHGDATALIAEIEREIRHRRLTLRPIKRYRHREPTNGKLRVIGVESVKQQVCDYVALEALRPLLTAKVGFWQVSSVKGKGQLMAAHAVHRWSQESGYYVHLDVRKCYPSIKPDAVMRILRRYVRSPDALYLCAALLSTYGNGLEIGSYFSLRMAQLVLSFGYHAVEGMHKARRARSVPLVTHQLWYADDIFLFSRDKRDLRSAARQLQRMLLKDFGLRLKPWKVCRVSDQEPVDVVGFTVRRDRVTLRATLFLRACRVFRKYRREPTARRARRVASYGGWFRHTDSLAAMQRNGFNEVLRDARRHVSAVERRRYELPNHVGHTA